MQIRSLALWICCLGFLPMMTSGQTLRKVCTEIISGEELSPGLKDVYAEKLDICGNTDYPDIFNLVYLCSGNDSFQINLYRLHKRKTRSLSKFKIRNAIPQEYIDAEVSFGFYRIYAQGTRLYIHYGSYITEVSFSPQFDEIDTIRHIDVKKLFNHSFLYLYPVGINGSSFVGILPRLFDLCPAQPEYRIIPTLINRSGDSLFEHSQYYPLEGFEEEFWPFFKFNPIVSDSRGIYVMSPLTQRLSRFDVENGRWQSIELKGAGQLANNYDCLDSVRKTTQNHRHALYTSCYPRNFYYKTVHANSSSLFLFRHYLDTDSVAYFIDEYRLDSPGSASYQGSLCLSRLSVPDASGNPVKWSSQSILLTPVFLNEKYFCRIIPIQPAVDQEEPTEATVNTLRLEIFYRK